MTTDPVCQMNVEERTAAGQSTHEGKTYYFCSLGCREAFEKDPASISQRRSTSWGGRPAFAVKRRAITQNSRAF